MCDEATRRSNGSVAQQQQSERDVDTMAASITIEEESGTYVGHAHPHNGYYAGDVSDPRVGPVAVASVCRE